MNTKVLIETITEIPDIELLSQLESNLKNTGSVIISDLKRLYQMFVSLFKCQDKKIIIKSFLLLSLVAKTLLPTELQACWNCIGRQIVRLGGTEDEQVRKKSKSSLFELLAFSQNSMMFLQTLYNEGIENEDLIVVASSIQIIQKIFLEHNNLLEHKSNIPIIKLIIQKVIRFTFKDQHINIYKKALQFLLALFYMNFSSLHQVLQRLDSSYLKALDKIWEKDKNQLIYKQKGEQQKIKSIQYQHLPLVKDKFFGIYEPFIIKNLFSPQTQAAKKYSVQQFQTKFMENEQLLSKYINLITKIIIKTLPDKSIQMAELLAHILGKPGISNIVNLHPLLEILLPQLGDSSVLYRKQVRECFLRLNRNAKNVMEFYNRKLNQIDRNNQEYDWILVYQLLSLVINWIELSQPADCYPPALNDAIIFSFNKRQTKIPKIKEKCSDFLFFILEKYTSYRETLESVLSQEQMGELEDQIQKRKNYMKLNQEHKKEAKQIFLQQYNQERNRYVKSLNK